MKRQTKLNKYLAGPKINRRFSAQLKRNKHNRAIEMDELLRKDQYYSELKRLKLEKLRASDPIARPPLPSSSADIEFEDVSEEILDAEFVEEKEKV